MADNPAEIRTQYLHSAGLQFYRYADLLGAFVFKRRWVI